MIPSAKRQYDVQSDYLILNQGHIKHNAFQKEESC